MTDEWIGSNLEVMFLSVVEILTWNFLGNPAVVGWGRGREKFLSQDNRCSPEIHKFRLLPLHQTARYFLTVM
jgi:hypothetical protein